MNKTILISLKRKLLGAAVTAVLLSPSLISGQENVARLWNETQLNSIKFDMPRPTVQARNLYHAAIAMYDSWAVYNDNSETVLLGKTLGGYTCPFDGIVIPEDVQAAQEEAMSYAMFRLMAHRYQLAPGVVSIYGMMNATMTQLGYNPGITSIDYSDGSPAKLGNYIAYHIIQYGFQDGSNEAANYASQYFIQVNSLSDHYLAMSSQLGQYLPGNPLILSPNHWQTLSLSENCAQGGEVGDTCVWVPNTPPQLTPEWGNVVPFSLTPDDLTIFQKPEGDFKVYHHQGPPPIVG